MQSSTLFAALLICTASSFCVASEETTKLETRNVTSPSDTYPDISPDGERIVFQSNRSGTWQIWVVSADGSGLQRLTMSSANDTMPVWSPDGKRVLFVSDRISKLLIDEESRPPGSRDIFVMDLSKGDAFAEQSIRVVVHNESDEMHPEWAEDGNKILFNRVYDSKDGASILLANTDGSDEKEVRTDRGWNTYAAMTLDGSKIVWRGTIQQLKSDEQNSEIFLAQVDGSNRKRLTNHPAFDGWPTISPDGKTVAFSSNRIGDLFQIFTVPLDGGEPRQITFGNAYHHTQPAFSADGKTLAVYRWQQDKYGSIGHIITVDLEH